MSTSTGEPPTRRPTTGRNFVGLLRALLPSLVIVLFLVWWQRGDARPVPTVDPAPDVAYAQRSSPVRLPAPGPLPEGWRATSSRVDAPSGEGRSPVTLTIGYLTPAERYAQLVISDLPPGRAVRESVPGATRDGGGGVAGWDRYRTSRGEVALVRQQGQATVLVTGDAAVEDLVRLAESVR